MPYGYDPILTSFTSITTSSSDCPGEGTKRTYQGLWRLSDFEGRANIALRVARSVARRRQLHWLRRCDPRQSSLEYPGLRGEGSTPVSLPPPTLSVRRFLHVRDSHKSLNLISSAGMAFTKFKAGIIGRFSWLRKFGRQANANRVCLE